MAVEERVGVAEEEGVAFETENMRYFDGLRVLYERAVGVDHLGGRRSAGCCGGGGGG